MSKLKGRAKQFQDLDEHIAKDYDPEADVDAGEEVNGSGSEASEDENAGTEHYVSVGKSKLRQKDGVALGPQYRGARVSRDALEQESDDDNEEDEDEEDSGDEEYADPETANLELDTANAVSDSEISSDNALAESDEERLKDFTFRGSSKPKKTLSKVKKQRATAADFMSSSDEGGADVDGEDDDMSGVELDGSEEDEDMDDGLDALVDGGDSDEDEDDEDDDGEDDDEDDDEEDDEEADEDEDEDDSESDEDEGSKKKKQQSAKPALAALSNRVDVDKGLAIRQQRKAYDGLLNLRIRLQKALVAANTFETLEGSPEPESEPYEAAEEAAIKLLNTISSLRDNFGARAGDKRKLEASMSTEDIWKEMQEEEGRSIKFREDRLEKWSRKVQSINVTTPGGLGSRNKTLISALQEQLNNPENRLVKRSRVPRSCAPAQAAKGVTEDEHIYDDADFYQQLLKELVDQRTVDGSSAQGGAVPTVVLTASKDVKMRKNVDRKASKGRKMRFTVHEKLQNFMAPEDRRAWEQEAIDRFFGTLFGRKMELNEDDSDDDMEVDAEEAGLRLFRN